MVEHEKEVGREGTICSSKAVGGNEKVSLSVVCGGEEGGEQTSGEEGDGEATRSDSTKRGCEEGGEEESRKRSKRDVIVVEEEEVLEIDARYGEYLYENWMWGSMRENRFAFPSVSMWYWLAVLKERLWQRYNIFYDADAIGEVYPENEIAGWVWEACHAKIEPRVIWRDREMSFEWTNDWCGRQAPREVRSYEEELRVQSRRRNYREGRFAWNTGKGIEMPRRPRVMRLSSEKKFAFWKRRNVSGLGGEFPVRRSTTPRSRIILNGTRFNGR